MMSRKAEAVDLINKKIAGNSFLSYQEIATITGYHPKYILKLKKEILNNEIRLEHGNKNRKPINTISEQEKKYIQVYHNILHFHPTKKDNLSCPKIYAFAITSFY